MPSKKYHHADVHVDDDDGDGGGGGGDDDEVDVRRPGVQPRSVDPQQ